jgi:hypothetical protein
VFEINVPLGLAALAANRRARVARGGDEARPPGIGLITASVTAIVLPLAPGLAAVGAGMGLGIVPLATNLLAPLRPDVAVLSRLLPGPGAGERPGVLR